MLLIYFYLIVQFISWKLTSGVASSAEQYLIIHKFGHVSLSP